MTDVAYFTFNPFQENTYIVYDDSKECLIFDPGCHNESEQKQLTDFIENNGLTPVKLINTHCHIDHVLGNAFIAEKYGLKLEMHRGEIPVLEAVTHYAQSLGVNYTPSPNAEVFLEAGDWIEFGNNARLKILFTPGHSPASISFYNEADQYIIAGDVLFLQSVGRVDLPGGDGPTLMKSIREEFFVLPDAVKVYPGHGPSTTVGFEKVNNPFLNGSYTF